MRLSSPVPLPQLVLGNTRIPFRHPGKWMTPDSEDQLGAPSPGTTSCLGVWVWEHFARAESIVYSLNDLRRVNALV